MSYGERDSARRGPGRWPEEGTRTGTVEKWKRWKTLSVGRGPGRWPEERQGFVYPSG